ncbi:dihydrofolate reductase family protein [Bacillus sp. FJAT-47783]|uniref:dihydrofolate reductase family protein n=1 Tax=Bacillus sp. FJAT-47783 TaxID=2922712 RepID=UPI001FAD383A|nr:dihydrofolate reductase family protein [Bacillus sp. FJAT-47783]
MRKLIAQEVISLDGFFAGPNGEVDWHQVDHEYEEYAKEFLESLDMLLFGRVTYQLMASFWPTATGDIATQMNRHAKVVFSKTLKEASWENTRLVNENALGEIRKLKEQPGKDLAVLGSAELASCLLNAGLINEYHITVVPVVLGSGKPLFKDVHDRVKMKLKSVNTLGSGHVQLFYETVKK